MNDMENKRSDPETAPEADHTPAPADPSQVLSPRRRSALVSYLAVLFAVAFLFVALMMVVEAKRLKTMNEELQDSSQKKSASLTNNINALQAENQKLSQSNEELTAQAAALEAELERVGGEKLELETQLSDLSAQLENAETEKQELNTRLETLTRQAEDAVTVSELLHKALAADEAGDLESLQELLEQIEPLQDLLSPTEAEIYEELKIA